MTSSSKMIWPFTLVCGWKEIGLAHSCREMGFALPRNFLKSWSCKVQSRCTEAIFLVHTRQTWFTLHRIFYQVHRFSLPVLHSTELGPRKKRKKWTQKPSFPGLVCCSWEWVRSEVRPLCIGCFFPSPPRVRKVTSVLTSGTAAGHAHFTRTLWRDRTQWRRPACTTRSGRWIAAPTPWRGRGRIVVGEERRGGGWEGKGKWEPSGMSVSL